MLFSKGKKTLDICILKKPVIEWKSHPRFFKSPRSLYQKTVSKNFILFKKNLTWNRKFIIFLIFSVSVNIDPAIWISVLGGFSWAVDFPLALNEAWRDERLGKRSISIKKQEVFFTSIQIKAAHEPRFNLTPKCAQLGNGINNFHADQKRINKRIVCRIHCRSL